jgi:hypothetical protein
LIQDLTCRFIIGGLIVSVFAVIADILKPKSFAGLFGAAPSVALATLSLTIRTKGRYYAAIEAHSMIAGAIAFFVYACLCARLMKKHNMHAAAATTAGLVAWLACAFGAWLFVFR